jgi:hypothetical protein
MLIGSIAFVIRKRVSFDRSSCPLSGEAEKMSISFDPDGIGFIGGPYGSNYGRGFYIQKKDLRGQSVASYPENSKAERRADSSRKAAVEPFILLELLEFFFDVAEANIVIDKVAVERHGNGIKLAFYPAERTLHVALGVVVIAFPLSHGTTQPFHHFFLGWAGGANGMVDGLGAGAVL